MPGTVKGTKDKVVHYKANTTDPGMQSVNNFENKNEVKKVKSDHKHSHPTSESVLPPSATSEPKNHKKTDPGMHLDIKSVAPTTTNATDKTNPSSRNNSKVTLGTSTSPTSTKPASQAGTTSAPQFNNNNNPIKITGSIMTKTSHMYKKLHRTCPKARQLDCQ
jgi:hypothetical protein